MKMLIPTFFLTVFVVPTSLMAQPDFCPAYQNQTRHAQTLMQRFDSNQDGQLTLDEVQAQHDAEFTQVDTDSDNMLSLEEFVQLAQIRKKSRFDEMDTNHDASISLDEFVAKQQKWVNKPSNSMNQRFPRRFTSADANGDQKLSFEEFLSLTAGTPHAQRLATRFARLDNNQDGFLSRAEFVSQIRIFDRFDCNEDGLLTQTELTQKSCPK